MGKALKPFGLEIAGDLRAVRADRLHDWLGEQGVVVFRDQALDDAEFAGVLRGLGPLTFTQGETPVDGHPDLNVVTNRGRTRPPRSVFHSDTSYVPEPPSYTALRIIDVPESGGQTLFSDQVAASERMPARCRESLMGRTVRHGVTGLAGRDDTHIHPLFRVHPRSGRTALYLSTPERVSELSGVDAQASARLIRAMYAHSTRPGHLYRHDWRAGDVVMWDNRTTMHRADHSAVVGHRTLHRGMVAGQAPIAAV